MPKAVKKPWGYEYLLYENENVGLWYLNIKQNAKTSLHCHPNKKTGLIVLAGTAEVNFLSNSFRLYPNDKIMIRQGVFHSTTANDTDLELLEIETPKQKTDIVRIKDAYGRAGQPYEGEEALFEQPPKSAILNKLNFKTITSINEIDTSPMAKLIILSGGIFADKYCVCGPGDIVSFSTFKLLSSEFQLCRTELIQT